MLVWFPARPQSSLYLLFPLVEAQGEDVRVDPEAVLQVHLSEKKRTIISVPIIVVIILEPFRRVLVVNIEKQKTI